MALTSGYFNSINQDRLYNAETMSRYFSGIISRGVLQNYLGVFQVQAATGMSVTVQTGRAFFTDGKWCENTTAETLALGASEISLNRIDRVVLHKDVSTASRTVTLIIKPGTPSATPEPPTLENTADVEEISLAQIYVSANASTITQVNITDERPNNDVCGFVHGLIEQIDTASLFAQSDASFNDWFNVVKDTITSTGSVGVYENTYTATGDNVTSIPIGISQYNYALDFLHVYINGFKLVPNVDFEVNGNENITLTHAINTGTPVSFVVFKNLATT